MHWRDTGILLAVRKFGENNAVATVMTRDHGRHSGLVHGGSGRRRRGMLQLGNKVDISWRGRVDEHLGTFTLELLVPNAALVMDDPLKLAALTSACTITERALPDREPQPAIYAGLEILIDAIAGSEIWPPVYVRFELGLLSALGFGLELDRCAATGVTTDLTHVSPKTGRAVSAATAVPYHDRLLPLPGFLAPQSGGPPANHQDRDIIAGLNLTGHFLERHIFAPENGGLPVARTRFIERYVHQSPTSSV